MELGINTVVVRQFNTQLFDLLCLQIDAVKVSAAGAGVEVAVRTLANAVRAVFCHLAIISHPIGIQIVAVQMS